MGHFGVNLANAATAAAAVCPSTLTLTRMQARTRKKEAASHTTLLSAKRECVLMHKLGEFFSFFFRRVQ
jgi:hypothetical protein